MSNHKPKYESYDYRNLQTHKHRILHIIVKHLFKFAPKSRNSNLKILDHYDKLYDRCIAKKTFTHKTDIDECLTMMGFNSNGV